MAKRKSKSPSLFDRLDADANVLSRPPADGGDEHVALHEAAQSRYLNYALSVITSRALPDVRDGLKPVQRRILYTMWQQNLTADAKHRKCAKVVGDVMGNYHPHGDAALYETLVRMAQPFSLRYPLVDGSGNFGSLDGDSAAAMRYTECRLARISDEMLTRDRSGHGRVPAQLRRHARRAGRPAGADSQPAHQRRHRHRRRHGDQHPAAQPRRRSARRSSKMIDADMELTSAQLCKYIKGPDFPTGGQIVNTAEEIRDIYKTGSGTIRIRATWQEGPATRGGKTIYITSVPYTVNKATLVERIADVALSRKLPHLRRRQGPVDRRRADCAGAEGRRRTSGW